MTLIETFKSISPAIRAAYGALAVGLLAGLALAPDKAAATALFVVESLIVIAPIVIPGIVLAAWITASGAADRVAAAFRGRMLTAVLGASAIGAITPVCGVTVLPLMAGLLAGGVPFAPVMAFWLSSPITDPAMLATTSATLGLSFAIGKTIAAFALGIFGGLVSAGFAETAWAHAPLRRNWLTARLGTRCQAEEAPFQAAIWREAPRRARFRREAWSITRLMLIVLTPAFAAEYVLNAMLQPGAMSAYVGEDNPWAVPLAVLVGAPAYVDGYAALPLTRALLEAGMAPGAAMAFLISGGVVSIWGAMAIFPVLRIKPFLLYLALALLGSMISGWAFGAWM
ncbi:permease [Afifella pfennigii]|uniref:permease n=1 Tax=Afifella pfennigii TaxID=209897 RepID=UPI000A0268E2|nr:permease [Afifella pfennigii]